MSTAPTNEQLPKRRRVNRGRSRTGCTTCKVRRVKCDETRPICTQCSSTGRWCEGYDFQYLPCKIVLCPQNPPKQFPTSTLSAGQNSTMQYFQFFCQDLAGRISNPFNRDFWAITMPQASHAEPAVFSTILAISSIIYPNQTQFRSQSSRFYGTALSQLRALLSTDTPDIQTVSLCCLGLTCFEILQGHNEAALTHLEGCLKMIQSADSQSVQNLDQSILQCLTSFDQQASQYLAGRAPAIPAAAITTTVSTTGGIDTAWHSLTILSSRVFHFIRSKADPFRAGDMDLDADGIADLGLEKETLLHGLGQWFVDHETTLGNLRDQNQPDHAINSNLLLIQHALLTIHCGTWLGPGQTIYDDFDEEFERIVLLAQTLRDIPSFSTREFSIDAGIVEPLYITAMRCRRSDLRYAALKMLKSGVCQEGVWSSSAMGAAVEKIIEVEELGWDRESFQRVPESCRAQGVLIHTDPLRKTVQVTYGWPSNTPLAEPASKILMTGWA